MGLSVRPLGDPNDLGARFDHLLLRESPFRNHRYFTPDEMLSVSQHEFQEGCLIDERVVFSLLKDGDIVGFCCCSKINWDSRYFALPMARLDVFCLPELGIESITGLIKRVLGVSLRKYGFRHVSCRINFDDYDLFNAMTSLGFGLVDVQRVYVARRSGRKEMGRELFMPRRYCSGDRESLLKLFQGVSFESRYTRDARLPKDKTGKIYMQWISNIVDMPDTEREIYVLERDGVIVAAGAGRCRDFSGAGVNKKIMTDGVFASGKGYTGSYVSITRAVVSAGVGQNCPLAELKVSANNHAANRVLQYLGYENVTQTYAFHKSF